MEEEGIGDQVGLGFLSFAWGVWEAPTQAMHAFRPWDGAYAEHGKRDLGWVKGASTVLYRGGDRNILKLSLNIFRGV